MGVSILPITVGATILFVIGEGWLLSQLMRQNGRLLVRVDNLELRLEQRGVIHPSNQGLAVGVLSPNFQLTDLSGTVFLHDKVFFQRSISSSTNSPSYLLDYCGHILLSYAI